MLFPRVSIALGRFLAPITKKNLGSSAAEATVNIVEQVAAIEKAFDESAEQQKAKKRGQSHLRTTLGANPAKKEAAPQTEADKISAGHATRLLLDAYRILKEQQIVSKYGLGLRTYLSGPREDQKTKKLSKGIIINETVK